VMVVMIVCERHSCGSVRERREERINESGRGRNMKSRKVALSRQKCFEMLFRGVGFVGVSVRIVDCMLLSGGRNWEKWMWSGIPGTVK
jgi:hypothetical protein